MARHGTHFLSRTCRTSTWTEPSGTSMSRLKSRDGPKIHKNIEVSTPTRIHSGNWLVLWMCNGPHLESDSRNVCIGFLSVVSEKKHTCCIQLDQFQTVGKQCHNLNDLRRLQIPFFKTREHTQPHLFVKNVLRPVFLSRNVHQLPSQLVLPHNGTEVLGHSAAQLLLVISGGHQGQVVRLLGVAAGGVEAWKTGTFWRSLGTYKSDKRSYKSYKISI